jgi:hypothetical protein
LALKIRALNLEIIKPGALGAAAILPQQAMRVCRGGKMSQSAG